MLVSLNFIVSKAFSKHHIITNATTPSVIDTFNQCHHTSQKGMQEKSNFLAMSVINSHELNYPCTRGRYVHTNLRVHTCFSILYCIIQLLSRRVSYNHHLIQSSQLKGGTQVRKEYNQVTHPELQECNQSSSFGTMTSSVMINTQTVNFIISWYMIQKQQNTQGKLQGQYIILAYQK